MLMQALGWIHDLKLDSWKGNKIKGLFYLYEAIHPKEEFRFAP